MNPEVIVVGAASMDTKGRPRKVLVPATSNPGDIRISVGGVGRNVAEGLARLGVRTTLLSAVGDDEWGQRILECTAAGGADVSQVLIKKVRRACLCRPHLSHPGSAARQASARPLHGYP